MGRLGMELGIAPRILQSRRVGWMGSESVSSAEPVVSPASRVLERPSGIRRKLGISAAELSTTDTALSTSEQTLGTRQSSRRQQTCAADSGGEARHTADARYETGNTADAGCKTWHRAEACGRAEAEHTAIAEHKAKAEPGFEAEFAAEACDTTKAVFRFEIEFANEIGIEDETGGPTAEVTLGRVAGYSVRASRVNLRYGLNLAGAERF